MDIFNLKIDVDIDLAVEKLGQANLDMGQKIMANQMMSDIDDYVPYREGTLSQTVTASLDGKELHWNTPYARKMYYGDPGWNWTRTFHPLAGPAWDEIPKGIYMDDWKRAYVEGAKLHA